MHSLNRPINFIVAIDRDGALGSTSKLDMLWHLPADLRYFKRVTMGGSIIMGHRTYQSINRPLPGRQNIVLSYHNKPVAEGVELVHNPEEALELAKGPIYVIGGGQIFDLYFEQATRLYVTEVSIRSGGDIIFSIDPKKWKEVSRSSHGADDRNPYDYSFVIYERR